MLKPSPAKPITSEAVLHLHSEKATIWIISLEVYSLSAQYLLTSNYKVMTNSTWFSMTGFCFMSILKMAIFWRWTYSISPKFGASFLDAQTTFYTGLNVGWWWVRASTNIYLIYCSNDVLVNGSQDRILLCEFRIKVCCLFFAFLKKNNHRIWQS